MGRQVGKACPYLFVKVMVQLSTTLVSKETGLSLLGIITDYIIVLLLIIPETLVIMIKETI